MSEARKIVGIMLLRNEEWTVGMALESIIDFCDEIYVYDHQSEDRTWDVVSEISTRHPEIIARRITESRESHVPLEPLAGQPVWVFAADGDEVYDPKELAGLRIRLLNDEFAEYFKITAHCLHCTEWDLASETAQGYLTPPAKAVTKLYNFEAITEWSQVPRQRLHEGVLKFKTGYHDDLRYHFWKEFSWEESPFHCLHLCFFKRSSKVSESAAKKGIRNISDSASAKKQAQKKWFSALRERGAENEKASASKNDNYRVGEIQSVPLKGFVKHLKAFDQNRGQ
jgi:hypothetical protein